MPMKSATIWLACLLILGSWAGRADTKLDVGDDLLASGSIDAPSRTLIANDSSSLTFLFPPDSQGTRLPAIISGKQGDVVDLQLERTEFEHLVVQHLSPTSSLLRMVGENSEDGIVEVRGGAVVIPRIASLIDLTIDISLLDLLSRPMVNESEAFLVRIGTFGGDSDCTISGQAGSGDLMFQTIKLPVGTRIRELSFLGSDSLISEVQVGQLLVEVGHLSVEGSLRDRVAILPSHNSEHTIAVRSGHIRHASSAACMTACTGMSCEITTDISCNASDSIEVDVMESITLAASLSTDDGDIVLMAGELITIEDDLSITSGTGDISIGSTKVDIGVNSQEVVITSDSGHIDIGASGGNGAMPCGITVRETATITGSAAGMSIVANCMFSESVALEIQGSIISTAPDTDTTLNIMGMSAGSASSDVIGLQLTDSCMIELGRGSTSISGQGISSTIEAAAAITSRARISDQSTEAGTGIFQLTSSGSNQRIFVFTSNDSDTIDIRETQMIASGTVVDIQAADELVVSAFLADCLGPDCRFGKIVSKSSFDLFGVGEVELIDIEAESILVRATGEVTVTGSLRALNLPGTVSIAADSSSSTGSALVLQESTAIVGAVSITLSGDSNDGTGVELKGSFTAPSVQIDGSSKTGRGIDHILLSSVTFASANVVLTGSSSSSIGIALNDEIRLSRDPLASLSGTIALTGSSGSSVGVFMAGNSISLDGEDSFDVTIDGLCTESSFCVLMSGSSLGSEELPLVDVSITAFNGGTAIRLMDSLIFSSNDIIFFGASDIAQTTSQSINVGIDVQSAQTTSTRLVAANDLTLEGSCLSASFPNLQASCIGMVMRGDSDLPYSLEAGQSLTLSGLFEGFASESSGLIFQDGGFIEADEVVIFGSAAIVRDAQAAFGILFESGDYSFGSSPSVHMTGLSPTIGNALGVGVFIGVEETVISAPFSAIVIEGFGHLSCRGQCLGVIIHEAVTIDHGGLEIIGIGGEPPAFNGVPDNLSGVHLENPDLGSFVSIRGVGGRLTLSPGISVDSETFGRPGTVYDMTGIGTGSDESGSHGITFLVNNFSAAGSFTGVGGGFSSVGIFVRRRGNVNDLLFNQVALASFDGTVPLDVFGLIGVAIIADDFDVTFDGPTALFGSIPGASDAEITAAVGIRASELVINAPLDVSGTNGGSMESQAGVLFQADFVTINSETHVTGTCDGGAGIRIASEDEVCQLLVQAVTEFSGYSTGVGNMTNPSFGLDLPDTVANAPLVVEGTSTVLDNGIRVLNLSSTDSFTALDGILIEGIDVSGVFTLEEGGSISSADIAVDTSELNLPKGLAFLSSTVGAMTSDQATIGGAFVSDQATISLFSPSPVTIASDLTIDMNLRLLSLVQGGDVSVEIIGGDDALLAGVSIDGSLTATSGVDNVNVSGRISSSSQLWQSLSLAFIDSDSAVFVTETTIVFDTPLSGTPDSVIIDAEEIIFSPRNHTALETDVSVTGNTLFQAIMPNADVTFEGSVNFFQQPSLNAFPMVRQLLLNNCVATISGEAAGCVSVNSLVMQDSELQITLSVAGDGNEMCTNYDGVFMVGDRPVELILQNAQMTFDRQNLLLTDSVFPIVGFETIEGEFEDKEDATAISLPLGDAAIFYKSMLAFRSAIELAPVAPPRASPDFYTFLDLTPFTVSADDGVLLNDFFTPIPGNFLAAVLTSSPSDVSVLLDSTGAFAFSFSGNPTTFSFEYEAMDIFGETSLTTLVTVTIVRTPASSSPSMTPMPSVSPTVSLTSRPRASPSTTRSSSRIPAIGASVIVVPSLSRTSSRSDTPISPSPSRTRLPSITPLVVNPCFNSDLVLCSDDEEILVLVTGVPGVTFNTPDPVLVRQVPEEELASAIIDITPEDGYEEGDEVEICFRIDMDLNRDSCLGFIDESRNPPEWRCEDECLDVRGNQACGTTDHFTNFAILLDGGKGGDGCGSSDDNYILNDWWQDLILILSCMILVCCFCFILCICLLTPPGQRLLMGREGHRVRSLRSNKLSNMSSTATA